MNNQSIFSIRHWQLPEILFVAAACFAMAAVGFFLAVFLQLSLSGPGTGTANYTTSELVPVEDKERVMQQVSASSPQPTGLGEGRNQADPSDPNADAKLKLLRSLNGQ